jgi:hypothetical protein
MCVQARAAAKQGVQFGHLKKTPLGLRGTCCPGPVHELVAARYDCCVLQEQRSITKTSLITTKTLVMSVSASSTLRLFVLTAKHAGSLDKADSNVGTGLVGAPACGDVMKLQVCVTGSGK